MQKFSLMTFVFRVMLVSINISGLIVAKNAQLNAADFISLDKERIGEKQRYKFRPALWYF